ncbi:MAG: flavodoxin [Candidatus Peregrinibacteria bacterium Greene0416_19]|nr:MAG: flavodoxin [Candidatus Peregrinibacteria bacterium Greene0416_19]
MPTLHPTSPEGRSPQRQTFDDRRTGAASPGSASLHILFASTSGHTEHVVDTLIQSLTGAGVPTATIEKQMVDLAKPEDLLHGDVVVLACGTWNTGGSEGQLSPHMHVYLRDTAKDVDLKGRSFAVIGLGDERYFYTARAGQYLKQFVEQHGGSLVVEPLKIVNEPYGQEETVRAWAKTLLPHLQ